MALTPVKFHQFSTDLAAGVHNNAINSDSDVLRIYLSNTAPNAATNAVKADLAEISTGNGYSGAVDVQNARSKSGVIITVNGTDITITASGGSIGPFRYAVLYNDTPTSPADPLIQYWDYGSAITLGAGEQVVLDIATSLFTIGGP